MSHEKFALHSFSIKNIFYDKIDLRHFYFQVTNWSQRYQILLTEMTALVDIVAFKVAQYTIKTYFCENDEMIL